MIWLSVRTTCRPSPTSSLICVLPWTITLHLAKDRRRFAPVRDGDGLRSGDEAVRVISGVAAFCSVWPRTWVDVRGRRIIASRDRQRRRWGECVAASQARQDGQPVGVVEVNGDRCCYPCSDDRLIIDYHVTMIGYGKKTSFTSLIMPQYNL